MSNVSQQINIPTARIFDVVVDRIEGIYAVCVQRASQSDSQEPNVYEESSIFPIDIELSKIFFSVKEGDTIQIKYTDPNNIEVIAKTPSIMKKRKKILPRYIRF